MIGVGGMRLIELFVGEEDYGRRWVVRIVLFGLLFEIGELRWHRLMIGVGAWACLGGCYHQRAWFAHPDGVRKLGPWEAFKRCYVRTLKGWEA